MSCSLRIHTMRLSSTLFKGQNSCVEALQGCSLEVGDWEMHEGCRQAVACVVDHPVQSPPLHGIFYLTADYRES